MKTLAGIILAFLVLGYGTIASAHEQARFLGIDKTLTAHGYATVRYEGQTYHLTEGDTIAGYTVILIDAADNQVIVKKNHHLKEFKFSNKK